ncbi:ATP-binding cassette domain-containing protein [Marinobacter salexigens]|uniref:ABC transporter ATP-binding protein/permease n=1 Tax=Marinobacter salexigens TaxID=1925763 RepID=A0ABS6A482_9GAMM|nr:ABC transporter ATP-binding protein [Marinobacter salexigens]MBU2872952.1 ABC transporter ATP-binding protein/permease [Marinobacter salexigens]
MNASTLNEKSTRKSPFSRDSRNRVLAISLGWIVVAALEATAYTTLALAIVHHHPPVTVVTSAAIAMLMTVLVTRAGFLSGARLSGDLYAALGNALARAKLSWFSGEHQAEVMVLAGRGIPGFMSIPAHQLQSLLHAPLIPLLLLIGLGLVGGLEIMLVAGCLLAMSLGMQFFAQRALKRIDIERHTRDLNTAQSTQELIDHLELLRNAAGPVLALKRIECQWEHQEQAMARINRGAAIAVFISALAGALPLVGLASYLIFTGFNNPGQLLALLVLITRAAAPMEELALSGLVINDLRAALKDYHQIIDAPALPEAGPDEVKQPEGYGLAATQVSHSPMLHDISVDAPEGARLLIVGPTGSGKSTLIELLMRFDDPERGEITLGKVPLAKIRYEDLMAHIAYVGQDPVIFTGTLADNIRIGKPHASDADLEKIARYVTLGSVIDRSPLGIEQPVGHQGSALSGGERQRLALARALIKGAPILVLDEATSALDQNTEKEIAKIIRRLPGTVILVTHRNETIWAPTHTIMLGG